MAARGSPSPMAATCTFTAPSVSGEINTDTRSTVFARAYSTQSVQIATEFLSQEQPPSTQIRNNVSSPPGFSKVGDSAIFHDF
jgi:hypothetical protein